VILSTNKGVKSTSVMDLIHGERQKETVTL